MLGGTQSLHTNALDEAIALPTDFSARIARNTQIVIQEETGMCNVVDPLGGSYYIEALTQQLVDQAWAIIERVEAEGGMAKAVAAGWPKAMIEEAAAARQARVDKGEDVIVGVNKYRLAQRRPHRDAGSGQPRRARGADRPARRRAGRARRGRLPRRAGRDHQGGHGRWQPSGPRRRGRAPSRHAGRISDAMEAVFGRHGTVPTPVKGVYGAAYAADARYAQVIEGVEAVTRRLGRKPRLLVAKMGQDGHDRGANVIASAFSDMGFDVTSGPLFQTPEETCVLALASDVDAIGASSLAAGHKTLIPS
jgi:methylmalonyl-CoA mutase